MTMNFTQIQITTYQIKKEFIMKEKRGWVLITLEMTSPIKFETIFVFLMRIETLSQLNYLQKV